MNPGSQSLCKVGILLPALLLFAETAGADRSVLGLYVGKWDVRIKTLQPEKPDISYTEHYEWVLDRKFIRGRTGRKSDGTEDVVYAAYDEQSKGYPFWIFSSSGSYTYLPPATWDARRRVMEWRNPSGWDVNYQGRCRFAPDNSRRCSLIMRDWKGKVLLEQEWTATPHRQ